MLARHRLKKQIITARKRNKKVVSKLPGDKDKVERREESYEA